MNPMIKLSGVGFFITSINELLYADQTITCNDIKSTVTTVYNSYEIKYSTQRTISTLSSWTSSVRGKNTRSVWIAIANFSRQNTSVSSHTEFFRYLDIDFSGFLTDTEKENLDILTW